MQKHLLRCLVVVVILSSCVSTARQKNTDTSKKRDFRTLPAVTSSFSDVDTTFISLPVLPAGTKAIALTELARTEEGAFVMEPGLYEADFKTYCLQPGTPGPSSRDVYFQANLEGSRKELIQTILQNSRKQSQLPQKNIQLLLWSTVSRSDFHKLAPEVQYTAMQLLSPKQLFELQGGVAGAVKTMARMLPSTGNQGEIRKLFDLGIQSYEAFERLAVINTPSELRRTDMTRDQWYQHPEGYYVRYLPNNYKETKIQVYVPAEAHAARDTADYMIFDPTSWVVVPANSNAQRLGIGGPVFDIIRKVIRVIEPSGKGQLPKKPVPEKNKNPKASY